LIAIIKFTPPSRQEPGGPPRLCLLAGCGRLEARMNRNRRRGAGRKFTGVLKQAAGRISGSRRLQIEGAVDRFAGGAQAALGRLQDRLMGETWARHTPHHSGGFASEVRNPRERV
jgi:uncharacterized protein YjbJ (UPF0337 family)